MSDYKSTIFWHSLVFFQKVVHIQIHCIKLLYIFSGQEQDMERVQLMWQVRATWWPKFHFRPEQVVASNIKERQCYVYKAVVAAILINKGISTNIIIYMTE